MRLRRLSMIVLVTTVAVAACATSTGRMVQSWKDPSVKKLDFDRVVAIGISEDGPTRRLAEAEMVKIIGADAVAASEVIPEAERKDLDQVRKRLVAAGFDGAITMRLVGAETELRDEQDPVPSAYYTFWNYYGFVTVSGRGPSYLAVDSKLQIEVNIYSLENEKLLWSGTAETLQPRLVETLVKDVAALVSKRLKREGLI